MDESILKKVEFRFQELMALPGQWLKVSSEEEANVLESMCALAGLKFQRTGNQLGPLVRFLTDEQHRKLMVSSNIFGPVE